MTHDQTNSADVLITRPGMSPVTGELIFACPNYYVVLIDGTERTLPAVDGRLTGFTVTRLADPR